MRCLFALIFFFPSMLFAQMAIHGFVVDDKQLPLPLSNIALLQKNAGTITDEKGGFTLPNILPTDSIKISNVAYYSKVIAMKDLNNNDTISLVENIRELNDVVIRDLSKFKQEIVLGMNGYPSNGSVRLWPGNELATYITNDKGKEGWIKGVSFRIKDLGKCSNSMRLRLLELDKETFKPSIDLLNENVVIESAHLKKYNYIDLSNYKIFMPKEGVVVVLEWMYPDQECDKHSYTSIEANLSLSEGIVWYNFRDKAWKKGPNVPNENFITPNIGLKVAY